MDTAKISFKLPIDELIDLKKTYTRVNILDIIATIGLLIIIIFLVFKSSRTIIIDQQSPLAFPDFTKPYVRE
jgi:hypothetical protein